MTDEAIIKMLFARLEESISEIDKKYGRKCRSMAAEIVGNAQDAEECVNDAYLGVWNAVPPEKPNPFSTFLYRILRNISLKKKRANNAQKRTCTYDEALDEIGDALASAETVENALARKDLRNIIRDFLLSLNEENRAVFVRRYWFMESCREIAAALGTSEKNITVRLTRTREKLRKYLDERGVEW